MRICLTKEAKKQFDNWLHMRFMFDDTPLTVDDFYILPLYLQWGAYQDFFYMLDIKLDVKPEDREEALIEVNWKFNKLQENEAGNKNK